MNVDICAISWRKNQHVEKLVEDSIFLSFKESILFREQKKGRPFRNSLFVFSI
jgi:hypothetical protein